MPDINDQISEKNVSLIIQAAKLDAKLLAKAIKLLIKGGQKLLSEKNMTGKGKQSVKQLVKQGQGVTNIEITDKNIKAFEKFARRYGVDFALKKDSTTVPPKWLVFFKAKDADALTAAFKEFVAYQASRSSRPSVLQALQQFAEKAKNQIIQIKDKIKDALTR